MSPENVPNLKLEPAVVSRWLPFLVPLEPSPSATRGPVADAPRGRSRADARCDARKRGVSERPAARAA